ncbi:MAG: gliding motility lipoprotein GldH [Chitinophagales bacterium]
MRFIWLLPLGMAVMLFTSCDRHRLYETNIPVKGEQWDYSDVKSFSFEVKDTSKAYNLFINVRHSFEFEWRNMYVQIATQFPDGKKMQKRVNLPLSEADGKWFGDCFGDNCDVPVMIQHDAHFPAVGTYTFSIAQDMRVNPLNRIKAVGLRVEESIKQEVK